MERTCSPGNVLDKMSEEHSYAKNVLYVSSDEIWRKGSYSNNGCYIDSGELDIEMKPTCLSGIAPDRELEEHCYAKNNVLYVSSDEIWKKGGTTTVPATTILEKPLK